MQLYGRKGEIADGGMIIKEMFPANYKEGDDPADYAIMVKDKAGSWDGWFWTDGEKLLTPDPQALSSSLYNYDFYPNAGFGLYCTNCHASADNLESTYSTIRNVLGDPITYASVDYTMPALRQPIRSFGIHHRHVLEKQSAPRSRPKAKYQPLPIDKSAMEHWKVREAQTDSLLPRPLPFRSYDHVVQGPRPSGHKQFLTSDQCQGCHDATANNSAVPNMISIRPAHSVKNASDNDEWINLSPYGEWRYSMMGLAGRDPVFFAQLEAERYHHPELADQIDNKCLSCHGVMG
jgi:hypothetical protein